jgi:hypothetical protein
MNNILQCVPPPFLFCVRYPLQWLQVDRGPAAAVAQALVSYALGTMCGECPAAWVLFGSHAPDDVAYAPEVGLAVCGPSC